jgi:hypothetical protein
MLRRRYLAPLSLSKYKIQELIGSRKHTALAVCPGETTSNP